MIYYILSGIAAVVILLVVVISRQPDEFRVTRTATINAPVAKVFEQINNFYNWQFWSPWVKLDPTAKVTLEGSPQGVGAISRWAGNSKIGEGSMTITESKSDEVILIDLEFIKPFKANNKTEFTFKAEGENQTVVTWTMTGKNSFMSKTISLIMNCEKMVGGQFEEGFANLKAAVESK